MKITKCLIAILIVSLLTQKIEPTSLRIAYFGQYSEQSVQDKIPIRELDPYFSHNILFGTALHLNELVQINLNSGVGVSFLRPPQRAIGIDPQNGRLMTINSTFDVLYFPLESFFLTSRLLLKIPFTYNTDTISNNGIETNQENVTNLRTAEWSMFAGLGYKYSSSDTVNFMISALYSPPITENIFKAENSASFILETGVEFKLR